MARCNLARGKINGSNPLSIIRFFNDSTNQTDRFELYNLKDDIGETKNLAAEKPELVHELDAQIAGFLKSTGALMPTPNPNYDPAAKAPPEGKPVKKPAQKKQTKPQVTDARTALEELSDEAVVSSPR